MAGHSYSDSHNKVFVFVGLIKGTTALILQ